MSSAGDLPALLRFLTQEAKIPLSTAMSKVQELQKVHLSSAAEISKSKIGTVQDVFQDEKLAKQVLSAAKRVNKKRTSGDISTESLANKKKRAEHPPDNPAAVEASLELPEPITDEDQLQNTVLITNRAPLLLAFAVHLLKYTKPEQPPSSRLSLAQAVVSANSKTKAVSIGLDKGKTAEQEGWGEGHPTAKVMDREIHVMKRWGYEWQSKDDDEKPGSEKKAQMADQEVTERTELQAPPQGDERPPLWGVDLEALRTKAGPSRQGTSNPSGLPVHNAESARAYLLKSFNSASGDDKKATTKQSAASKQAEKEHNLALLLGALDLLIRSWSKTLNSQDLDKRAWSWYTAVRPEVSGGAAGWGEKNQIKLSALLDLRKPG
ncbi:hypothetical protein IWZ00DRAFT_495939 [Phyllosticta capitalensis]|uniref:Impact N-terminal domain-containing protein n=1 Tax=Phyllosticta capitalensis TaxID=121624 RepID=A0ABR1Z491_9PEZI